MVAWVPINESWGVPNLPDNPAERHYVQALYHLTRTRSDGRYRERRLGERATDIIGIHDYDPDPERLARRYHADEALPRLFSRERPGGRLLVLEGQRHSDFLSRFRNAAASLFEDASGRLGLRTGPRTQTSLGEMYTRLMTALDSIGLLEWFLLYAVRGHLPGNEWPARCRTKSQDISGTDRRSDRRPAADQRARDSCR